VYSKGNREKERDGSFFGSWTEGKELQSVIAVEAKPVDNLGLLTFAVPIFATSRFCNFSILQIVILAISIFKFCLPHSPLGYCETHVPKRDFITS
jgi:hypothetical protein